MFGFLKKKEENFESLFVDDEEVKSEEENREENIEVNEEKNVEVNDMEDNIKEEKNESVKPETALKDKEENKEETVNFELEEAQKTEVFEIENTEKRPFIKEEKINIEKKESESEEREAEKREIYVTKGDVELEPDAALLLSIERKIYSLFKEKVSEKIDRDNLAIVKTYQTAEKKHFVEALVETNQMKPIEVFDLLKECVEEIGIDGVFFLEKYSYIDVIKTEREVRFKYHSVEITPKFFLSLKPSDIDEKKIVVLPLDEYKRLMSSVKSSEGRACEFEDILEAAIEAGASDIHIIPKEEGFYTFFRIKKQFIKQNQFYMDKTSWKEFIQKLNNKASEFARGSFDVDNRRITQEARIEYPDKGVSVRYEYVPRGYDDYGEVVCRILKKESISGKKPLEERLKDFGYHDEKLINIIKNIIHLEGGLVVISGKTNSGKSTFLGQLLVSIPETRKIGTIEDPIEYNYANKNIVQHQLYLPDSSQKMDFLDYVKAFKRADYDVVLVGEWRRSSGLTQAMIEQAQAGQLIFTTLHISSAYDIYAALYNIFEVPFNISAEVIYFSFNQTLAPKLCPHCSDEVVVEFTEDEVALLKNLPDDDKKSLLRFRAQGRRKNPEKAEKCKYCGGTGYIGFVPIYEYFIPNEKIKELVVSRKTSLSAVALRDYIRREMPEYVEKGFATFKIDQAKQLLEQGIIEKDIIFKI